MCDMRRRIHVCAPMSLASPVAARAREGDWERVTSVPVAHTHVSSSSYGTHVSSSSYDTHGLGERELPVYQCVSDERRIHGLGARVTRVSVPRATQTCILILI
jgi:hypothetical protein